MEKIFEQSLNRLTEYVEKEAYKGWDPYDGLNSTFFNKLPIISSNRICKLIWIQLFKRLPINLRNFFGVPKGYNSKGIALFLSGYCKLYISNKNNSTLEKIHFLAKLLLSMKSEGWSGYCWGYNFDWQARAFFQPKNTPTVVASVYAASALLEAYDLTGKQDYLDAAISCGNFITKDLNRTYDSEGDFCFSYSPLDKSIVYNASLLGSKLLANLYKYTNNDLYKEEARKSVKFCVKNQHSNGAWAYGQQSFHYWIDNFHTGFNLECIYSYQNCTGDNSFSKSIEKGFDYYINTFFEPDGKAKYYHNKTFPIDIHSPAQLVATLYCLNKFTEHKELCEKVLLWTINNMQDKSGFFFYQKKPLLSSKISYMRWAQAWMFNALHTYKLVTNES